MLNGDINIFSDGTLTVGSASTITFFINTGINSINQIFFRDVFENIFSIETGATTNPLALFLDRTHYPDVEDTVTASPSFVTLIGLGADPTGIIS